MHLYNYEQINPLSKSEVINLLDNYEDIPTLPGILTTILKKMEDPHYNINTLAQLIKKDPAISLKILKVTNSPIFRGIKGISSIEKSIIRLGKKEIKNIIMGISVVKCFEKYKQKNIDIEKIWKHSLAVAYLNTVISDIIGLKDDDIWLCGLIHNIGKILYVSIMPSTIEIIYNEVKNRCIPFRQVEKELLNFTHDQIGTWILKKWNIPTKITRVVSNYSEPPSNQFKYGKATMAIGITHISNSISKLAKIGDSKDIVTGINPNVWNYIPKEKINQENLIYSISNLKKEIEDMFNIFMS